MFDHECHSLLSLLLRKTSWLVLNGPHRLQWSRIIGQPWDDMPMDVRKLIAEQFIVDLHGIKHDRQCLRDFRHLLYELTALFTGEVKQLGCMPLEHQHRPPREELILVKIRDREIQ